MILRPLFYSASLLALVSRARAQLPYNPTRIISANNGSIAYLFTPQSSSNEFSMSVLDTSSNLKSSSSSRILFNNLPFLSVADVRSFIPLIDDNGNITVLAGSCEKKSEGVELWVFSLDSDKKNGTWSKRKTNIDDNSISADFLSAGFSFSSTGSEDDASTYLFGGMCPNGTTSNAQNWASSASYSNAMITVSPGSTSNSGSTDQLSVTVSEAPPIPEAGLTITPLIPTSSDDSSTNDLQQQNFVLLGGHTENAFINMSQVALYSLPQETWAFVSIDDPTDAGDGELIKRTGNTVEPRSGHTAVLTKDGSKIVVFGGWVGDISTPAQPQLAILNVGQGYGGLGDWKWMIPSVPSPLGSKQGIYGHGAAMLPGDVMIVSGGHNTGQSSSKLSRRSSDDFLFLNTTSMAWMDSYVSPHSPQSPSSQGGKPQHSGLKSSQKAGLGVGLVLGIAALAALIAFWILYSRRLRRERAIREKELRELALGTEHYKSPSLMAESDDHRYPQVRSASWNSMQERRIESTTDTFPWAPVISQDHANRIHLEKPEEDGNGVRQAERTGVLMDVPSPTRGLRRSLNSRGPIGMSGHLQSNSNPGGVFRIDEEEEGASQGGSIKRANSTNKVGDRSSVHSDPFKDPPPSLEPTAQDPAAQERKKEVQGWVEDWASVAESMNLSRNPSQAYSRTYSSLSHAYTNSHSGSDPSGRGSPEKSDRTGSNLSERSIMSTSSLQKSVAGTISRNLSLRSASAGYALFSGAAAAMGRLTGTRNNQQDYGTSGVVRAPSQRSVSLNIHPASTSSPTKDRDRTDTFSSARSQAGPVNPGEDQALLNRVNTINRPSTDDYWTPPESPVKDKYARAGSLTTSGRKTFGILGSVKRVFTGTGSVDVQDKVASLEGKTSSSSPTKTTVPPEMSEVSPTRSTSAGAGFWHGKRGARDWNDNQGVVVETQRQPSTVRRKPVPNQSNTINPLGQQEDEDWDVETAIQKRVVQVMFTVPKEKLRVVNADALSLLSSNRSEVDHDEEREREKEIRRMSSVKEIDGDGEGDGLYDFDHHFEMNTKGKEREI